MNKLRRSRPVKILCFLLGCIFLALFTLNCCISVTALFSDGLDPFSPDALSEYYTEAVFRDLTADKSRELLNAGVLYAALRCEGESFLENNRAFRAGQTNYAFTLTDAEGKTLLSNFMPKNTLYEYAVTLSVATYSNGGRIYTSYDSILEEYATNTAPDTTVSENEEQATAAPQATAPDARESSGAPTQEPTAEEATSAPAEETTSTPTQETSSAPAGETTSAPTQETTLPSPEPTTPTEQPEPAEAAGTAGRVNTNPVIEDEEDVYIQDDTDQGYKSIMMYIYPEADGVDQVILGHCLELYHKQFEPREAQYYLRGTYEIYHQTDFAVSSNGTAYFIGTEREEGVTREQPAPTLLREEFYTLTVRLDKSFPVKDLAYHAANVLDATETYFAHFNAFTTVFGIAALLLTVFSLCLAGYVKGEDAPVARGFHRFPTDLLFLLFAALVSVSLILFFDDLGSGETDIWFTALLVLPAAAAAAAAAFGCVYVYAVKLKSKTAISSMLLVRLVKWIVRLCKAASGAMNVLWKLGVAYAAGGVIGIAAILICYGDGAILLILYLLFKAAELIFFILLGINLRTLQKGAADLAQGKSVTVENRWLFGEFKKHAEYLNSIGDGINAAVEQRMKSENTKTELITNVSHDLKTPLTSIVNYVDLLKKEPIENPKAREYVEVIDRQSQKLKKLTADIVDASKAAAGSVTMNMEPTDLTVLLGQVKGEYAERLAAAGLTLVDSISPENTTVMADGRLLWRVFDNLMNNICKYSQPDTRVYVALKEEKGEVKAVFRNISAQPLNMDAEELTERFVRGDASRNTDGSGLGLYIAKSLCSAMGGSLLPEIDGDLFKATVSFPACK